jgi:hypothetical protein
MNRQACLFCGHRPVHLHHVTGRPGPGLPYLDSDLVVPLCRPCHHREHVVLRRLRLEWPTTDVLRHRRLRVGEHLGRLADADRWFAADPPSTRALSRLMLVRFDEREVVA